MSQPKSKEFECENCGCDIDEEEFERNDGLCDDCEYDLIEQFK